MDDKGGEGLRRSLWQTGRTSKFAMGMLLALTVGRPASAIVFQSLAAENVGLGAGHGFLDGEARLTITRSDGPGHFCSGSLLYGGAYVLTAAHCVTGSSDTASTSEISVFFANRRVSASSSTYIVDPVWTDSLNGGGDLALIRLDTPVTTVVGYHLDTASSAVGFSVVLAGYGYPGVGDTGATGSLGTLRYGTTVYPTPDLMGTYYFPFDPSGPEAAMIAPGDSGGATLAYINGFWEIVGVHGSYGCLPLNCTPDSKFGAIGGDASIYANTEFLDSVLVPEPTTAALLVVGLAATLRARRHPE